MAMSGALDKMGTNAVRSLGKDLGHTATQASEAVGKMASDGVNLMGALKAKLADILGGGKTIFDSGNPADGSWIAVTALKPSQLTVKPVSQQSGQVSSAKVKLEAPAGSDA